MNIYLKIRTSWWVPLIDRRYRLFWGFLFHFWFFAVVCVFLVISFMFVLLVVLQITRLMSLDLFTLLSSFLIKIDWLVYHFKLNVKWAVFQLYSWWETVNKVFNRLDKSRMINVLPKCLVIFCSGIPSRSAIFFNISRLC